MTLLAFLSPATDRVLLVVVVGGCYLGYHLYHLWQWWQHEKAKARGAEKVERVEVKRVENVAVESRAIEDRPTASEETAEASVPANPQTEISGKDVAAGNVAHEEPRALPSRNTTQGESIHCSSAPSPSPSDFTLPQPQVADTLSGEELYAQARAIPHQPIPDCEQDGEYLKLLVKSADLGYAWAASKLGEYAMRRNCMVEAYYWFSVAKKNGMRNLERTMLQIRSAWASDGFYCESENEYEYFSYERGSIGYALLCVDSGHNVDAAKSYLAASAASRRM